MSRLGKWMLKTAFKGYENTRGGGGGGRDCGGGGSSLVFKAVPKGNENLELAFYITNAEHQTV